MIIDFKAAFDSFKEFLTSGRKHSNVQIVVAPRGWVFVGYTTLEHNFIVIDNAHVVRIWGTTRGLGQLIDGPTSSTKLDFCGVTRVPRSALLALIDCDPNAWRSHLSGGTPTPVDPSDFEEREEDEDTQD